MSEPIPEFGPIVYREPPPGLSCKHGYPPGEFCPACGDVPIDQWDDVSEYHDPDCHCFDCDEETDGSR